MRAFFVQISGLIGVITFLNHLWKNASVERTVFVSMAVGLAIYAVLVLGDNVIRKILNKAEPVVPEDAKITKETVTSDASTKATDSSKAKTAKA